MPDFSMSLNEDQLQIQKWVHDFAEDVVRPAGRGVGRARGVPVADRRGGGQDRAVRLRLHGQRDVGDPTGLTLPVAIEELFWGDAGIGLAIFGLGARRRRHRRQRHARAGRWSGCRSATARRQGQARRLLRQRARRRLRRVVAAHPRRLRRGQRRVGAQRHQGVDHQRRHRRRPRRRRRGRPRAQGPRPGQLRRAARHQGPVAGPEVQEARHPGVAHRRGRARRRARARAAACSAARRSSTPSWPGPARRGHSRREAAGDGDVRGHPARRRRAGPRHRPRRLRVRARLRQGAQGVRQADHHEPGASPSSWPTWPPRSTPPACWSGGPRGWPATAATRNAEGSMSQAQGRPRSRCG